MSDGDRFYVTTPIYYVNDRPHIGHAYCTVLADVYRRYHQLFGAQTYFLTGTDEHGQKVQRAAEARGVTPQAHADSMHLAFRELWPEIHVSNDDFIRTTEARHQAVVQASLQQLYDVGDIYIQDYVGWYSTSEERFWTEKDLVDGRCPASGNPVERITERNYFFRMSKYADRLRQHIEANPDFIRPPHRANEVLGFLAKGVEDLCISRPKTRLEWGIELPFAPDYVTYVWFDALLNYVSAIGYRTDPERFQAWWPHAHHFIGKDILTTHSVYWTTMLMALGVELPQQIVATGWWLQDDAKMSKTRGNVVDPLGLKDVYGPDVLRYFLMRDMVIGLDSSFSEELLVRRNNSDLANDLGNLARRAAGLIERYFDGVVPDGGVPGPDEAPIIEQAAALVAAIPGLVDGLKLHTAIEEVLQLVRRLNKYVSDTAPFKTVKKDPAAAARSLYTVLEGLRHAACLLWPVMPRKMVTLLEAIGAAPEPVNLAELRWGTLEAGRPVQMERGLFPRAELPSAAEAPHGSPKQGGEKQRQPQKKKTKPTADAGPSTPAADGTVPFEAFEAVDLRVATVLVCERVEGAQKLLRFELDLGEQGRRQVVSGVAAYLEPTALVGSQVVLVANLAPRRIFGIESRGMLLTAETPEGGLALLRPAAAAIAGSRIG